MVDIRPPRLGFQGQEKEEMNISTTEIASQIRRIPANQTYGLGRACADKHGFYCVVRRMGGGYQVEAGWKIPDHYDSDADSVVGLLLDGAQVITESGVITDANEAARVYAQAKSAVMSRRPIDLGKTSTL